MKNSKEPKALETTYLDKIVKATLLQSWLITPNAQVNIKVFVYIVFSSLPGLGQTVTKPLEDENLSKLREDILNLLGMKHVPTSTSPHFVSHMDQASSKSTVRPDILSFKIDMMAGPSSSKRKQYICWLYDDDDNGLIHFHLYR